MSAAQRWAALVFLGEGWDMPGPEIAQYGLAKKKEQGKLTLEDVDEKLDVIIKILQDLMPSE